MRKLRVVQIGTHHEHANGKYLAALKLPELYDFIGIVDTPPSPAVRPEYISYDNLFKNVPRLTEDELYQRDDIDCVFVETPNEDLVPTGLRVMEHNLPMHLDKTAGYDLPLYQKLLDGCRTRNLPLQMGYMFRGNPAFQFVKKLAAQGAFGDIFSIDMDMDHGYGGDAYQTYVGRLRGGVMFNLGCHLIDFVVSVLGEPSAVHPFLKNTPDQHTTTLNATLAVLEYPHATATVRACSRLAGGTTFRRHCRLAGTRGYCEWSPLERFDGKPLQLKLHLEAPAEGLGVGDHVVDLPPQDDRYTVQLTEFAASVRDGAPAEYSYEHDFLVHKVSLAASGLI